LRVKPAMTKPSKGLRDSPGARYKGRDVRTNTVLYRAPCTVVHLFLNKID
jgi:hypothetical protein